MGKRSDGDFKRKARDYYKTPRAAVLPLIPYLKHGARFVEPCAGNGQLIDLLKEAGLKCARAWDIRPMRDDIDKRNALDMHVGNVDLFITNPPWDRKLLHPMIEHFSKQAPTWLLFDADWMHTVQSAELIKHCKVIISVGRIKWIPKSSSVGKDNCAWYLFDWKHKTGPKFIGRTAKNVKG